MARLAAEVAGVEAEAAHSAAAAAEEVRLAIALT